MTTEGTEEEADTVAAAAADIVAAGIVAVVAVGIVAAVVVGIVAEEEENAADQERETPPEEATAAVVDMGMAALAADLTTEVGTGDRRPAI